VHSHPSTSVVLFVALSERGMDFAVQGISLVSAEVDLWRDQSRFIWLSLPLHDRKSDDICLSNMDCGSSYGNTVKEITCWRLWTKPTVLSLARMDLIFFIAACMVLCFRFVAKTMPITH